MFCTKFLEVETRARVRRSSGHDAHAHLAFTPESAAMSESPSHEAGEQALRRTETAEPTTNGAGDTHAEPAPPPSHTGRKRAWALATALTAMALGGLALGGGGGPGAPSASPGGAPPRVEGDRIVYDDSFARRAGIQATPVKRAELVPVISAVGTVDFDAEHVAAVGTRLRGLVSRVLSYEGDTVKLGATLARVESAELGEAQATVGMLDAKRDAAVLNAQRESLLAQRSLTTAREVEAATVEERKASLMLSAAKQKVVALTGSAAPKSEGALGAHELRAPIAGTIVERRVAPGQFVEGGLVAFKLANLDHLWVELDVFERNLSRIRLGDLTELRPLSGSGELWTGRVAKISSTIDPVTHSARVRIEVENRERRLRVGQAVQATIRASGGPSGDRPVVPTKAITFVDGKPTLFAVAGPNAVRKVTVELGAADEDETEIVSNLSDVHHVVTEGVFALKSELFR
jgi:membrane fusion protein, heavy metal efflux system